MPQDAQASTPADLGPDDVLARIQSDHAWARSTTTQVGAQPATVYAAKYAEDVGYLLKLLGVAEPAPAAPPPPVDSLERALVDDAKVPRSTKQR